jgi:hypothetical protein
VFCEFVLEVDGWLAAGHLRQRNGNEKEGDVVGAWEDLGVGVCCYEGQDATESFIRAGGS